MKVSPEGVRFDAPKIHAEMLAYGSEAPAEALLKALEALEAPLSPEAEQLAMDFGSVALESVVENPSIDADPTKEDETEVIESHANSTADNAVDFALSQKTNKNGVISNNIYALAEDGTKRKVAADDMLVARGYDPSSYKDHKAEFPDEARAAAEKPVVETQPITTGSTERPISTSRFHVEPVAPIVEPAEPIPSGRIGKLVDKISGKASAIADRVEGAADIRRDTKRMIEQQKVAVDVLVDKAKSDRVSSVKARYASLKRNNIVARNFGQVAGERKALKDSRVAAKYAEIDKARALKNEKRNRDPNAESKTDSLRRFGARITSRIEARAMTKASSRAEMARAKTTQQEARDEHRRQKDRRSSLRRGVFNSGHTLSGAVDSRISSFSRAGEYARTSEQDRIDAGKKREAELKARSDAARERAKARTAEQSKKLREDRKDMVDKFKSER